MVLAIAIRIPKSDQYKKITDFAAYSCSFNRARVLISVSAGSLFTLQIYFPGLQIYIVLLNSIDENTVAQKIP